MASEVRLAGSDRRNPMLDLPLPRRVRLSVRPAEEPERDSLRAARGILLGSLLGAAAWTLIGIAVWLIAR